LANKLKKYKHALIEGRAVSDIIAEAIDKMLAYKIANRIAVHLI
jgi:hypothetical protein